MLEAEIENIVSLGFLYYYGLGLQLDRRAVVAYKLVQGGQKLCIALAGRIYRHHPSLGYSAGVND